MILAVFNQKGGVGKTTTVLNLGAALAARGLSPLLIDLDPQAHLSLAVGAQNARPEDSTFALFRDPRPLADLIQARPGFDLIPAAAELSKVESLYGGDAAAARRLSEALRSLAVPPSRPVLIDCSPVLGVLSLNALLAADWILIPLGGDFLSMDSLTRLSGGLDVLEKRTGRRLVRRIVFTRFMARRRLSQEIYRRVDARFPGQLCRTLIAENVSLAESPMHGRDVLAHAPSSQGAADYRALLRELLEGGFLEAPAQATSVV